MSPGRVLKALAEGGLRSVGLRGEAGRPWTEVPAAYAQSEASVLWEPRLLPTVPERPDP